MTTFPAGCYGKLPIFADFIRHNAHGPEIETLDQWFQEGIYLARQTLGARWDAGYDQAPASRFVYRAPGSARILIGVCVPGTDKAGRRYPFTIFLTAEAAPFDRDAAVLPVMFRPVLDAAQELATKGWIGSDAKQLIARADALKSMEVGPADGFRALYTEFLRREKSSRLWSDLFGSFDHIGKYMLMGNLRDAIGAIRNAPPGRPALGLRFPLPASLSAEASGYEVTFWLDLALRLIGRRGAPPLAFWNQRGTSADPGLFLFFSAPAPRSFIPLFRPGHESDQIWDLAKGDPARAEAAKASLRPALDNPDLSLADMLARLGS